MVALHLLPLSGNECYHCVSRSESVALWSGCFVAIILILTGAYYYYENVDTQFMQTTAFETFDEIGGVSFM